MTHVPELRIGVISFAHPHAESYVRVLSTMPGVQVLACDPDSQHWGRGELRGRPLADQLGVSYVDELDALYAWGPDAVIVTSENALHRVHVERAASHGVHVLCEKPLATNAADADAMNAACAAAGVQLMTAYPVRFAPEFVALRAAVRAGELGRVLTINGTNNGKIPVGDRGWFTDPVLSGGGALVDHIVHIADLLDELLGRALPERVHAVTNHILHADLPQVQVETGGLVSLTYAAGATVVIDCSWSQPDAAATWGGLTMEVVGSRGSARIAPFGKHVGGTVGGAAAHLGFGVDLDELMLAEFLGAIREARTPSPDGEAGLRSLRIVLAAQESSRGGLPVVLA